MFLHKKCHRLTRTCIALFNHTPASCSQGSKVGFVLRGHKHERLGCTAESCRFHEQLQELAFELSLVHNKGTIQARTRNPNFPLECSDIYHLHVDAWMWAVEFWRAWLQRCLPSFQNNGTNCGTWFVVVEGKKNIWNSRPMSLLHSYSTLSTNRAMSSFTLSNYFHSVSLHSRKCASTHGLDMLTKLTDLSAYVTV